jgi:N-acetylneuraminic acid mutarotase
MKKKFCFRSGFFNLRVMIAVVVCAAATASSIVTGTLLAFSHPQAASNASHRTLTFEERVAYQKAIEDVYWRHRIWPKGSLGPKPSLDAVMSQAQLEKKVADYLLNSQALEDYWQQPITAEQLQAEMDRMAQHTRQPEVLQELFAALGNDPFIIAECLARPVVAERLANNLDTRDQRILGDGKHGAEADLQAHKTIEQTKFEFRTVRKENQTSATMATRIDYAVPKIPDGGCVDDSWTATNTANAPDGRYAHTTVWTGSEMIVWGGQGESGFLNTGGQYNPSTDNWTATSIVNAPSARRFHTAVWTGTEMIIWGGDDDNGPFVNTGGRYDPGTDSWIATGTANAPSGRDLHTAVWTGTEMIAWGGSGQSGLLNTGGKYNPNTDSWTATSTDNAPTSRLFHTALWTGSEMVIWGGDDTNFVPLNTGGRYSPATDSWIATSTTNAPDARAGHTAVWTDNEMIVWAGSSGPGIFFNTGGRYNPDTDSWTATSTANAPIGRDMHTAVWSNTEMVVWGGFDGTDSNTGGKYNPSTDSWRATSTLNAPTEREFHTAVWTGNEMIIWGGTDEFNITTLNTGGRYCAQSGPPPTPTPTPRVTPRPRPTPHVRPTPP